ncbi:1,2-phenylacetyl-CoA epoxidase, subunit E [Nymphon striatum]|nr:1,2-phenylacetyl-CoA epoxidase, subunit E [Nymphon striatum]
MQFLQRAYPGCHVVTAMEQPSVETIWDWLADVADPEIPVISIVDLGIVRAVEWKGEQLEIAVTPTYSGCPATTVISMDIETALRDHGIDDLRRSYSICCGLDDEALQVGIKRVEGGAFSTWANEDLKIGDVIEAMPPMGTFHAPLDPSAGKNYLAFAGGSGITPILSILRTILTREPNSQFTLVYANRAVSTIMFRDELEDLKNQHMGRLNIIHVLESDALDIDLFQGRIDGEKCAALFQHWIDPSRIDTAFICGPEPMMLAISKSLKDHGLADEQIKFELFASGQPGRAKQKQARQNDNPNTGTQAQVTLDW